MDEAEELETLGAPEREEAPGAAPEAAPEAAPRPEASPGGELSSSVAFRAAGRRNDGAVEASVSEDWMSARATFTPPIGDGLPLDRSYVEALLERLGLSEGVLWEEIGEALLACNLDRRIVRDLVIARGREPVEEIPEHAELAERFGQRLPLVPEGAPRVDYKELSSLVVVRKGEPIARIVPKRPGEEGRDLRGQRRPPPRRSVDTYLPGKNVEHRGAALVALCDGLLAVSGNRLDVEEVLLVKGAVDYHTGHIIFPGDVVIEGAVGDGFKVWSGGSIVCKSTMDAFDVHAKKDLLSAQGIIGRRRAQIRVGGELRAKFVQNCKLAVRGDIRVATALVNCRAYSLGLVDLGDRGVLMGGEVYAVHGVRAGRIGNQARQKTIVHAGTDFTVQQRLDQANEELRVLAYRAQQADVLAANRPGERAAALKAEIEKAALAARILIGRLLESLDADEGAVVEVRGEVFPGSVIEICRVSIVVDEPLRSCRFRLDKAAGRILVERLGGGK